MTTRARSRKPFKLSKNDFMPRWLPGHRGTGPRSRSVYSSNQRTAVWSWFDDCNRLWHSDVVVCNTSISKTTTVTVTSWQGTFDWFHWISSPRPYAHAHAHSQKVACAYSESHAQKQVQNLTSLLEKGLCRDLDFWICQIWTKTDAWNNHVHSLSLIKWFIGVVNLLKLSWLANTGLKMFTTPSARLSTLTWRISRQTHTHTHTH
jgi:hypothetical protein